MKWPENIQEIIHEDFDYMGFIFYSKSRRFIADSVSEAEVKKIGEIKKTVGVFVNDSADTIIDKCKKYGLEYAQLHGNESPEECCIVAQHFNVIKAFGMDDDFDFSDLIPYSQHCDFYLFDTKSPDYGGTGKNFNLKKLMEYDNHKPFFLSGGISAASISELSELKNMNMHALDVNSKLESAPGIKNAEVVCDFIHQLQKSGLRNKEL